MKPVHKALAAKEKKDKLKAIQNLAIVQKVNLTILKKEITITEACRLHDIAVDKYYRYRNKKI